MTHKYVLSYEKYVSCLTYISIFYTNIFDTLSTEWTQQAFTNPARLFAIHVQRLWGIVRSDDNEFGPFYWQRSIEIIAWISNDIHGFMWEIVTHPCPNFNGSLS